MGAKDNSENPVEKMDSENDDQKTLGETTKAEDYGKTDARAYNQKNHHQAL